MFFSPLETSQVYLFPWIQIEEDKLGRLHTIHIFASFCIFVLAREISRVNAGPSFWVHIEYSPRSRGSKLCLLSSGCSLWGVEIAQECLRNIRGAFRNAPGQHVKSMCSPAT